MNPETLDSILKDPKLQAALASKYWSQQEAEILLAALKRSGLLPRRFAECVGIGYRRLSERLQRLERTQQGAAAPAIAEPCLPPQFLALQVSETPAATTPSLSRPLGLKIRFYRPSPETPEQLVMELEVPLW
jgi:hypothetical protein